MLPQFRQVNSLIPWIAGLPVRKITQYHINAFIRQTGHCLQAVALNNFI
jgi:hypothetical protein